MTTSRTSFPYGNIIKNLPFIAFVRKKSAQGRYSYDFPFSKDREYLSFFSEEDILTDSDGCLDIVCWEDKDKLAKAISVSEQEMTVSSESFSVVLPSGKKLWLTGAAIPKKQKNGDIVWKGFWQDVTSEKKKDYFNSLVLESVREGIVAFDHQGHIFSFSPSLMKMLSCSSEDIENKTIFSLLPDEAAATLQQYMLLSALKEESVMQLPLQKEDGETSVLEIEMRQKGDFFVYLFRDVTEICKREEDLLFLACHDAKTGVENYTYLKDAFAKAYERSKVSQTQIAVLSVALDSLGQLNAVDQRVNARVVAEIANRIRSCLHPEDSLAQIENYRFAVLITGLEFSLSVEKKIEDIFKSFEQPIIVDDLEFDLSVSVGVCFCPQDGNVLEDLIFRSDLALEKIKSGERSAMRIYNNDLSMKAAINMNMRRNLKRAIENDEIKAFFQPQVDIKTGQIVGLEALARWFTSDGMVIPPSEFISEAEEYGLIDFLTEVVLDQACKWNQKWYSMGLCNVPVAVNISGRQFHNETQLLCLVDKALNVSGLPPYLLELELTESSAMLDPENAQRIIQTLLDNNIRCALDDFGTGYSSLSVLRSFPLKKLKIDRSFVLELNERKNLEIVRAAIVMAHALNLSVLAEGVENRKNFEILKDLGCDIIQGYLFSRPLPPDQTELLLMRWDAEKAATGSIY